jgi:hypothetical protein
MKSRSIAASAVRLLMLLSFLAVPAHAADLKDVIGSYHHSPMYTFNRPWPPTDGTKRDIINEGADELLNMGSKVIRVILHPNAVAFYPQIANPAFPVNTLFGFPAETRLRETAKTVQYDTLFHKNFSTFIITTMANVSKRDGLGNEQVQFFGFCGADDGTDAPILDGMTSAEITTERTAIKNLAVHLLTTFNGTNKTFIIATGEGDWIAREPHWGDVNFQITSLRAQAMRDWINARADGVADARALVSSTAKVYTSAEANFLQQAIDHSELTMTNDIIPYTHADLYSYTAYGTGNDPATLVTYLDYLKSKAPDSMAFGANNIFIGEYGAAENSDHGGDATAAKETLRRMTETSISWGARYVILWELYDSAILAPYNPWNLSNTPAPSQMAGYWLRRPDGTYPPIYGYYQSQTSMTATAIALRCYSGGYVTAADDGGAAVYGNSPHILGWEELTLIDQNGGTLNSGDYVTILTRNGHFFMAMNNGGSTLDSSSTHPQAWETFRIWRTSGTGAITNGTSVAFQAGSGHYLDAEQGGAQKSVYVDPINANRTSIGPWETFTFVTR